MVTDESKNVRRSLSGAFDTPVVPVVVARAASGAKLDRLRIREKAHSREGNAIAATRRLSLEGGGEPVTNPATMSARLPWKLTEATKGS